MAMTPDELDQFFKANASVDNRTVDSFPPGISNEPTVELHDPINLPELESPSTGKMPEMPTLEDAPWKSAKAITPTAEAAESEAPSFLQNIANKFPDKESFVNYFKRFASLGEEGAESLAKKLGVGGAAEAAEDSIPAIGGEAALGPLAVGYEALKSAPGPEGLTDYSPSTIAMIKGKQQDPSLFDMVHNKYQDLQKANEVGESQSPNSTPDTTSLNMKSRISGMPSSAVATPPPTNTSNTKDYLKDLVNNLYKDMGDQDMKDAQAQRNQQQMNAAISKAGSQLGSAISRGTGGNLAPDTSVQDTLMKQADQPIQDIQDRRKAVLEKLEGGLKASDLIDHEKLRDANSPVSESYRNMALQLNPKLAETPGFNQMNAEGIKQLLPMVDLSIKAQVAKDNHDLSFMIKQQKDQADAKAKMTTSIATILNRGAPAKAMDVDRRVDNINSLTQMYPDLNKMPQNQVNALTDEITQIVTGGMSTEGKSAKLMNPSLASGFQNLMGKTLGKPTGAQLGSFIQEYLPYMQDLQNNARGYIKDSITPIMVGHNKKVAPEDMNEVKQTYSKYLNPVSSNISTHGVPKIGDVDSGYKFKGGDPSKSENWDRVQ